MEVVKASQYVELANDLEINKAITYLRQKDFNQVSSAASLMLVVQETNTGELLSRTLLKCPTPELYPIHKTLTIFTCWFCFLKYKYFPYISYC